MRKEVTTKKYYIHYTIVLDGQKLKFTRGKGIQTESSVVKDETLDNEEEK